MEKASQAHTDPGLPLDANQRPLAGLDLPTPDPEALTGKTEAQVPVDAGQREPVPEVKSPPEAVSNTEEAKDKAKGGKPGDVGRKWGAGIEGAEGRAKKEVDEKSEKEIKVEAELNSILKRSPSKSTSSRTCAGRAAISIFAGTLAIRADRLLSNHLLQILLPLLEKGQGRILEIQHHAGPLHRRAGPARAGVGPAGSARENDEEEDSAEHSSRRYEYWRRG